MYPYARISCSCCSQSIYSRLSFLEIILQKKLNPAAQNSALEGGFEYAVIFKTVLV